MVQVILGRGTIYHSVDKGSSLYALVDKNYLLHLFSTSYKSWSLTRINFSWSYILTG